ncbi:myelin-oligodendrocyte glycoprotein-like [Latimeria chalumnae]|uniref:myelin-oligodendrocyte glycoprotein-like n=1 Tax=Latimeria chalumnae TaxID=7897 RepID=UPI00313DBB4C
MIFKIFREDIQVFRGRRSWFYPLHGVHGLMLLSLVTSCAGQHPVVNGVVGEDVPLPCKFQEDPKGSLSSLTVSWEYVINGSENKVVHSYHELKDYPKYQDVQFKGRTKLFHSELKERNASLLLSNLTEADQGEYDCVVDILNGSRHHIIFLNVTGPGSIQFEFHSPELSYETLSIMSIFVLQVVKDMAVGKICRIIEQTIRDGALQREGESVGRSSETRTEEILQQRVW